MTTSSYYTDARVDSFNQIVLPCLLATTGDWMLVDMATAAQTRLLTTFGIHPERAESGYGYIAKGRPGC